MHGLACAYYLAKHHGITDVAVLEKSYIGSGGSGRNTTIIRSNYLTPEGVASTTRASSSTRTCRETWTSTSCSASAGT